MLKITKLETFADDFTCFTRVSCEDGSFGWGQCANYNADITAQIFHRQIAPWALGAPRKQPLPAYQSPSVERCVTM